VPLTSSARQVYLDKRTRRPAVGTSRSGHELTNAPQQTICELRGCSGVFRRCSYPPRTVQPPGQDYGDKAGLVSCKSYLNAPFWLTTARVFMVPLANQLKCSPARNTGQCVC